MKLKAKPQPLAIITSYTPLVTRFGLVAENGSRVQFYYTNEATFNPSREVTPLVIRPYLNVVDPDGVIPTGDKSASLAMTWYEGSYDNQITSITDGYAVNSDNTLTVKKNVMPDAPIQILARAYYTDSRNGNQLVFEDRMTLNSVNKSDNTLSIVTDQPNKLTFDPLSDDADISIKATLRLGREEVASGNAKFWWYAVNGGVETLIDELETAVEYVSGQGTDTLAVNAMYTNLTFIRVRGTYYEGTAPTEPPANAPYADVAILYKLPMVRAEIYSPNGSTLRSTEGAKTFKCILLTSKRALTDAEIQEHYLIRWYKKPLVAGGTASRLGDGVSISVDADGLRLNSRQTMSVYPEVYSRGAYGYVVDSSGNAVTDTDGKLILART